MDEKYEFQVGNRDCNDTAIVIADWDNDTDDEDDWLEQPFLDMGIMEWITEKQKFSLKIC